jgi:hypothetical protein
MTADIRDLNVPSWRGILFPGKNRQHRFAHEASPQHVSYNEGDFFDMTGSRARTWTYQVPFNEGLTKSWDNLFSKTYPEFYKAYRDRSPGTLVDPLQGPVLCVPGSYEDELSPMVLDGVTVDVTFSEHTPVTGSQLDSPPDIASVFSDAAALDQNVRTNWPSDIKPNNLTDPISAVTGVINQGNKMRRKFRAALLRVADRAAKLERACAELEHNGGPKVNAIRLSARKLRLDSTKVANAPPREAIATTIQIANDAPKTVIQAARDSGMDLADFIDFNRDLAKTGMVPVGYMIWVVRK